MFEAEISWRDGLLTHCNFQMSQKTSVKVTRGAQEMGVYPIDEALWLVDYGPLRETDHYWHEGMTGSAPLSSLRLHKQADQPTQEPKAAPARSLEGRVLDWNKVKFSGLILGVDGLRYKFSAKEWRSDFQLPAPGAIVNFEVRDSDAVSIYVTSAPESAVAKPVAARAAAREMPEWYRSSDDKQFGGVCGGLADKWNRNTSLIRLVFLMLVPFAITFYIIMWLSLPECKTADRR
jgi:phage shock protein PspC (stress-responsive transcriptional regulator)